MLEQKNIEYNNFDLDVYIALLLYRRYITYTVQICPHLMCDYILLILILALKWNIGVMTLSRGLRRDLLTVHGCLQ